MVFPYQTAIIDAQEDYDNINDSNSFGNHFLPKIQIKRRTLQRVLMGNKSRLHQKKEGCSRSKYFTRNSLNPALSILHCVFMRVF